MVLCGGIAHTIKTTRLLVKSPFIIETLNINTHVQLVHFTQIASLQGHPVFPDSTLSALSHLKQMSQDVEK